MDLSNNRMLKTLYVNNNLLTNLDLTNNTLLESVYCFNNELSGLDIAGINSLRILSCYANNMGDDPDISVIGWRKHFTEAGTNTSGSFRYFPQRPRPSAYNVSGMVRSYNSNNPIELMLMQGSEIKYKEIIKAESGNGQHDQNFTIKGVEPGIYTLVVTKKAHLKFTVHNVVVEDKDFDLVDDKREPVGVLTLKCGDLNGDGQINSGDLLMLLGSYQG